MLDRDRRIHLAGEVAKLTGIHISEDDVSFVLVALNDLVLESRTDLVSKSIDELRAKVKWELAGVSVDLLEITKCADRLSKTSKEIGDRLQEREAAVKQSLTCHADALAVEIGNSVSLAVEESAKRGAEESFRGMASKIANGVMMFEEAAVLIRHQRLLIVGSSFMAALLGAVIGRLF